VLSPEGKRHAPRALPRSIAAREPTKLRVKPPFAGEAQIGLLA